MLKTNHSNKNEECILGIVHMYAMTKKESELASNQI